MLLYSDAQLLGTFNSKNDRYEQVSMNVYSFVPLQRQQCQNVSIDFTIFKWTLSNYAAPGF